jgi:cell division protein FtsN
MTMRALPYLIALLLGVGAALLAGCGDRSNLIPPGAAGNVKEQLSTVQAAVADGSCGEVGAAVNRAQSAVTNMPEDVDPRLKQRLRSGLDNLLSRAQRECDAADKPSTTSTQTLPTTETTAPETTSTEETPSVPADSVPTEPSTPVEPTPTDPNEGGGISPDPTTGTTPVPPPDPGGAAPPDPGTGGDPGFRGAFRHHRDRGPLQGYNP